MKTIDPDGHDIIPLNPELDLNKEGFGVIELGVRNLVEVLWKLGYRTVCSCAGHEGGLEPYPWVVIPINLTTDTKALVQLAQVIASFNAVQGENGKMPNAIDCWTLVPMVGHAGFAVYLQPLNNNVDRSPEVISKLRKNADELAIFLSSELGIGND